MDNCRGTKRPAEEDIDHRAPKRRCISLPITIELDPISFTIDTVPPMKEPANQRPADVQSRHHPSVTSSEAIPHDVTSIESPVTVTEVSPITPIGARLPPIPAVDAGQIVAYKEAPKKTKEAIKNGSHGTSFPTQGDLESKGSKRLHLDLLAGDNGQPIASSISNMEVTANQYPIGIQSSHSSSVTASLEISHGVTSIESPEVLIGLTPSAPVGHHLTSCTAIQGEQVATKEDVSKESLRGQIAAPNANTEATAKTEGEPKNTSSGTKRPAEDDLESKDPKRPRLDIPAGVDIQSIPDSTPNMEAANQYPIGTQSSHSSSVTASLEIAHGVTSIESPEVLIGLTPSAPVGHHLTSCTAIQGEQVATKEDVSKESLHGQIAAPNANMEATAKTEGEPKNTSSGTKRPAEDDLESKDPKRPRLDIPAGVDIQSIPDSTPNMEAANQYPIGTQSSHPSSVTASLEIAHGATSIESPEVLIGLTPSAPVGHHLTSCTAIQGEQVATKEDVSKESLHGQIAAPNANMEATAKTEGEPKNTSSGTKRPAEDDLESKDPKRPRLDIPAGVDIHSIPDSTPNMEVYADQYPIGTQPSQPTPATTPQAVSYSVASTENQEIPNVTPSASVEASLLPNPETDYFVSSTAIYGEQQATSGKTTMAPPLKGIPANKYSSVESVHKKILGPKARAEAARAEAEAREEAFFGPKVPTTHRAKKSSAVNKKARSGISKAGPQLLTTSSTQIPATRASPAMNFLFNVDADTPKEQIKSSATLAASLAFTANSERLLAMLRENRPAAKVKRSGTALSPIAVDGQNSPEEAEPGYVEVDGGRSYFELENLSEEPNLGHSDSEYFAAALSELRELRERVAAGALGGAGLAQLQDSGEGEAEKNISEEGGIGAGSYEGADAEEFLGSGYDGDKEGASSGTPSEGGKVIEPEETESGSDDESSGDDSSDTSSEGGEAIQSEETESGSSDESSGDDSSDTSSEGGEAIQSEETEGSSDDENSGDDSCEEVELLESEGDESSEEVEFVEPDDDIFGPGWCNGAGPVPPEEDEDWGGSSDSSYKEGSSDSESSEDGDGQEEGRGPSPPRRIIYLAPDRFAEQVLRRRVPMYGVDTHTARDAEDMDGLSSDESDSESEAEEISASSSYLPHSLQLPYYPRTLAPKIAEKTDDVPEDEGSGGIVGEGSATATRDAVDIADNATKEEVLAGIPLPSDPCFEQPRSVRYIPRGSEYTDIVYELEWKRGYTRAQSLWLLGTDRPGERKVDSNVICMRVSRYAKKLGIQKVAKLPTWNKRTAPDDAEGAKAYSPGLLEELATRYGEESLVPASGDWELDLVPQWARRIWRLFARACKLRSLGTPEEAKEAIAELVALASAWGLSDSWVEDGLDVGYNTIGMYQLLPSFNDDGVMGIVGEDHCVWRLLHQHIDRVKRDVYRWRMENRLGMATKYGGAWERLLKINWRD